MKKYLFLFLIIISCNKTSPKKENLEFRKENLTPKKELKKFYDADEIEHFYLNISEEKIMELFEKRKRNPERDKLKSLLVSHYPNSISEPNFEADLTKFKFVKTQLSEIKKKEVENIFSQKDSVQTEFSSCLPYYRDIFIFKKNDSIVGIAKVCFGCGVSQFNGTKINTEGFGLRSQLEELEKIIRNK